jgi:hypothetical protein
MEQYWNDDYQGKIEESGKKSDPLPLRPPRISRDVTRD